MARREKKGKRQEWDIFRGTRVLKVKRGRANAGITDARFALQEWQMRKRADSESTNPDPRQNNHGNILEYKTNTERKAKNMIENLNTQPSTYSGSGVLQSTHLTKNCVLAISLRGKLNTKGTRAGIKAS